jgi:hypothetical protein
MDPFTTFCLAAVVFLSLPLPLFAGTALAGRVAGRRSIVRWVWADKACGTLAGLLIVMAA